jgi:hypothetical protein
MSNLQTLKSASHVKVDQGKAINLYASRQNLGEGLFCPASAHVLRHDIYMRPANQNTLTVNLDASCAQYSEYPAQRQIGIENMTRPYLSIGSSGLTGSDLMGKGRDMVVSNLYQEHPTDRGHFVRHYPNRKNAPFDKPSSCSSQYYSDRKIQPYSYSHDASSTYLYSG